MRKTLTIGVMGPGANATEQEILLAEKVGKIIARKGHYVLTGGSNTGVMNAALKGAKSYDSKTGTIAILSHNGEIEKTSPYADVCIPTGMGEGRNYMNIRSCDIIIFCCNNLYKSAGTFSEFAFTIKHRKPVIFLHQKDDPNNKFRKIWEQLLTSICEEDQHEDQIIADNIQDLDKYLDIIIEKISNIHT
ncbi:TPA: cytochrome [Candidatus Nomurabacteria bacterium]|uniref:Lysine decarboxylase family protein n=1 Tax=Candidatus Nomurabacteria bacterium GW2011_GWE1_35_16 TaxID=1618761 RepID=A0A0G0DV89_9BACT|nr:MAG: Lysine decarboxylase family protein [Candidatus Nomurabacteria bacterium GW2011_GWF1_34_20]KKP63733.1 MAG: Lysine decarboxylase family protein [Candidatus Nomurabacteria bacterium GW2011_GWE2_34_25]KKP66945.1 MAG: Lysine decarboxylase family protein [Candidatus Nomurabacteria bacterium GW2011_GWE1_35_16]HAE36769.1 cytochrome [Candidatus Nomurabacteria bacterium]HAX65528.1 cytochrome [Candidatus Nomurabacteria bacterium]